MHACTHTHTHTHTHMHTRHTHTHTHAHATHTHTHTQANAVRREILSTFTLPEQKNCMSRPHAKPKDGRFSIERHTFGTPE